MTSNVFRRGSLPSSDQNSNDVAAVIPDTMWLNHQREGRWEDHENQELNHLLQEAMIERNSNGRWIKDPVTRITKYSSCPPGNVVRLGGGNTLKFVNLSASNYEMAREVDMNLAEVDMETFRTQDLEQPAFRLTYSSPVNDDMMVRISGTRDRGMDCLLTNSTSFGLDRSRSESIFRDEMLFSTSPPMSGSKSLHKSILTNQTFSLDSLSVISDSSRELVLKCHQADKTKYMIAFDSSRIGSADGGAGNAAGAGAGDYVENDFLTASLNHNSRRQQQQQPHQHLLLDSSMTGSMNGNTGAVNGGGSNATFTTVTSSDPESDFKVNYSDHRRLLPSHGDHNIPIFDLEAGRRDHGHGVEMTGGQDHFSNSSSDFSSPLSPGTESGGSSSSPQGKNLQDFSDTEPVIQRTFKHMNRQQQQQQQQHHHHHPSTGHTSHRQDSLGLQAACNHALDRCKMGASPIHEEEEPSTDSSRADVEMRSRGGSSCDHHPHPQQPLNPYPLQSGVRRDSKGRTWDPGMNGRPNRSQGKNGQAFNAAYESHNGYEGSHAHQYHYHHPVYPIPDPPDWSSCRNRRTTTVHGSQRIRSAPQTPCSNHAPSNFPPPHGMCPMSTCGNAAWQQAENYMSKPAETLYVCYPNYSLPDLSFLNASPGNGASPAGSQGKGSSSSGVMIPADANVLLSPTKPMQRPLVSQTTGAAVVPGSKGFSGRKARPKSFDDIGNLSKSTIAAVKDWESLNFLLPEDVRQFLGVKGLSPVTDADKTFPPAPAARNAPGKLFSPSTATAPPIVKMRKRVAPRDPLKRLSLQEQTVRKAGWQLQQQQQQQVSGTRHLTRSETMQPHMQYGYSASHMCGCHRVNSAGGHCCHANPAPTPCFHTPAHATCCRPVPSTWCPHPNLQQDDRSIDTLCHLLSMQDAVTDVADLVRDLSFGKDDTEQKAKQEVKVVKSNPTSKQSSVGKTKVKPVPVATKATVVKPVPPPKPKSLPNNSNFNVNNNESGQHMKSPTTPFKSLIPIPRGIKTPTKSSKRCV